MPPSDDAEDFHAHGRQNENASKIVYSSQMDRVPKVLKSGGEDEPESAEEWKKEIEESAQRTKAALEKIEKNVASQSSDTKFIKYKPCQRWAASNSGAKEREFIVGGPAGTFEPPKFRHKRIIPKPSGSPPVPILHSPPRHQQDWKIPPCIPNWKNPNGFTIPLDKGLAADDRGLQDVPTVSKFAQRSDALYNAMLKTSEAEAMRMKVEKEMLLKEKEQELRNLAQKARCERTAGAPPPSSVPMPTSDRSDCTCEDMREDYEREKIREERKRERERERSLESKDAAAMGKKSCIPGVEIMYDERPFNQEKRMDSRFATDDQHNVYVTAGVPSPRDKLPVEFDKSEEAAAADPFGLDKFCQR